MNEEENVVKEEIQIPITIVAKMICDNLFNKDTKEKFYQRYLPVVLAEGNVMKEQMTKELGNDTGGEEWNPEQDAQALKIRNDAIINTIERAVLANLEAGFMYAKDVILREIMRKVRGELMK